MLVLPQVLGSRTIQGVGTILLHHFVVVSHDEKGSGPALPLSFKIADAAIEPRRSLGSLPFNCACEPIFTALPTFHSGFHFRHLLL